nr:TMV resistance protein N [Tanacetum cinerariifolium]
MHPSSSSPSSLIKMKRDPYSYDEPEPDSERPKNDLFMNYYEDIGKQFISHLKRALRRRGFTISEHAMLHGGQDTHLQLLKGIEESKIFVVIFSTNYASSVRSLDELVDIMDRLDKDEGKFVSKIVKELECMQSPQELHVADHPIVIGSRVKELISTLRLDYEDILVVLVFGIGGI